MLVLRWFLKPLPDATEAAGRTLVAPVDKLTKCPQTVKRSEGFNSLK